MKRISKKKAKKLTVAGAHLGHKVAKKHTSRKRTSKKRA